MKIETIEKALKENGEIMVKTDSGETFELHSHNAFFEDGLIRMEAGTEIYWLSPEKIEYYWIHKKVK